MLNALIYFGDGITGRQLFISFIIGCDFRFPEGRSPRMQVKVILKTGPHFLGLDLPHFAFVELVGLAL